MGAAATGAIGWSATHLAAPWIGALGYPSIDGPASAQRSARRGADLQATPPWGWPYRWSPGDFVTHVAIEGDRPMMALTFDDGPIPAYTASVLRTLAERGVTATFFMVGVNVRSFPDLARQVAEEGHEIGNHSVYHTPYYAPSLAQQMRPNQEIIRSATGVTPLVSRTPGLAKGTAVLEECRALGMYECHTHMAGYDAVDPRYSAAELCSLFARSHRNGAFALFHDGGAHRQTAEALPCIIDHALANGYELVTATELTHHGTPLPGTFGYPPSLASGDPAGDPPDDDPPTVSLEGRYDVRLELERQLDDPTLSAVTRSRIVEVLAEMDDLERRSNG
ncbi:MAG TPA: polysaccharide deacetylase family protein [Ilumatobacter sp.]